VYGALVVALQPDPGICGFVEPSTNMRLMALEQQQSTACKLDISSGEQLPETHLINIQ
jgi:hypothetical protein